jgi:hypothetical protein
MFRFRFFLLLTIVLGLARGGRAQGFDPRGAVPPDSLKAAEAPLPVVPILPPNASDSLRRQFNQERTRLRLEAYARRKTIMGKAAAAVFDFSKRSNEQAGLDAVLLDRQFDKHNFKVVRRINIRPYSAFGYSLNDSLRQPRTFFEKAGNALHVRTSRTRIRQVLTFRPGDVLQPQDLSESERLLRQTPELLDARVLVNERTSTADSVDLEVLTTDVFTLTGGAELSNATAGRITLGDQNFLGLGHQIDNAYTYGRNLTPNNEGETPQRWAYQGSYTVPFRHFFQAQARYLNEYNQERGGVSIRRDFYSPTTRYAGALAADWYDLMIVPILPPAGEPLVFEPLRYNVQDLWAGRSIRLRSYDLGYENPGRLIVASRLIRTTYQSVPTLAPEQGLRYYDGTLLLGTLGYSVRRYYKDRYLFGFGRTEDVPTGTLVSATLGYEFNDVVPRRYVAGRLATGAFSPTRGYLYSSVELGVYQRLDHTRTWEQGLLSTELTAFTRLYHRGNWQYRHFLSSRGTIGLDRRPGEVLLGISDDRGIRGFAPDPAIRATSRFTMKYETVLFTPLSLVGFRLAGVLFADAAWVTQRQGGGSPFHEAPYTGFGVGLRLRNEFTAFRTFQLLLGFYPKGQLTPNGLRMFETAREAVQFSDFGLGAPGVGVYQ